MTQTTDLEQRLRAVESSGLPSMEKGVTTCWYRNPDGPEAADEFARLRAENEALREALGQAEAWFEDYAEQHSAKALTASDSYENAARIRKAAANRDRAAYCRAALKGQSHE